MTIKQLVAAGTLALAGIAVLAPTVAAAAPHYKKHKVCKWDRHHHQRVCHWVR